MRSFICEFAYMRLKNDPFSGTYPLIYSDRKVKSFHMRIHYMQAYFWSPCHSNIMRPTCNPKMQTFYLLNVKTFETEYYPIQK
jgi:hypothetical protein